MRTTITTMSLPVRKKSNRRVSNGEAKKM
jgi:hypothetical protein